MTILIQNGLLINPKGKSGEYDVLIKDTKIEAIAPRGELVAADEIIDAAGMWIMPGFVDMHCHLREPGQEHKEDIATGTLSAAYGGFTAVACMPNTAPVNDNEMVTRFILQKAKEVASCRVYPIAAITKGLKGAELAEFGILLENGAVAFSDDGRPVEDANRMRLALQYAKGFDALLISHCEDLSIAGEGVMNEGITSALCGLKGISRAAEEVILARELLLAEAYGTRVHIAHISTKGGVELLRQAKRRGVPATGETCPHYFSATDELCKEYDTNAKMNPPLRTAEDVEAIKRGLADGTIDAIATDHAPHSRDEKRVEFQCAPNGIIGLETAFSLAVTNLIEPGVLTPEQLVQRMSCRPAEILGVVGGLIAEGLPADIAIADPKAEIVYTEENLHSKSANSPFLNKTYRGKVVCTMMDGIVRARR
ncbi:MAG: dihydroorotase [Christensenellales bacterium]|jgi:dihydroorotase